MDTNTATQENTMDTTAPTLTRSICCQESISRPGHSGPWYCDKCHGEAFGTDARRARSIADNAPLAPVAAASAPEAARSFQYVVHTVSGWRLTGETVATGTSAEAVMEDFLARGYVKVEVAPAAPINGFPNAVAGVDYRSGDTASHDTRR